jgi:hypothetical protein
MQQPRGAQAWGVVLSLKLLPCNLGTANGERGLDWGITAPRLSGILLESYEWTIDSAEKVV